MTIRELTTLFGFEIDDSAFKEYEKKIDSIKKTVEQGLEIALGFNVNDGGLEDYTDKIASAEDAAMEGVETDLSFNVDSTPLEEFKQEASSAKQESAELAKSADNVSKSVKPIGSNAKKSYGEYEKSAASAKEKTDDLAKAIKSVSNAVKFIGGTIVAGAIVSLGKSIYDVTGEVEQYRVVLGQMIGDQEKANEIISNLDGGEVSDFYGTAATVGGLQNMVTFGMEAQEASDTLTKLGDIAQGNVEAFKSLSQNMGQVFAKNKADATDLKQFAMQGFDVVGEISAMTGKSREQIQKAGVSYEQCAEALRRVTGEGGKYNGMLKKQQQTLPGIIKQFQSLSATIKESIGMSVMDNLKQVMLYTLDVGKNMKDNIAAVGTKVFDTVIRAVARFQMFLFDLKCRLEEFGDTFTPIKELVRDVFGFFGSVIESMYPFLMNLAQMIVLMFKPIQAFLQPVLKALKVVFKDAFQTAADNVGFLLPLINALTPVFSLLGRIIGFVILVLNKMYSILSKVGRTLVNPFDRGVKVVRNLLKIIKTLKDFFVGLWNALKQSPAEAIEYIKDAFLGLFDGIKQKFTGFIDGIKEGWDKVKGFFGGIADGVVNFVTGGSKKGDEPKKANDLIVTPDGTYSTHPDDYIMAMKNPGGILDALSSMLSGMQAPQGVPGGTSLAGSAASRAVHNVSNFDNSRHSSSQTFNSPISVTVNASGMSADQARKMVEKGVKNALRDAIAGSRGVIPSPEARRA